MKSTATIEAVNSTEDYIPDVSGADSLPESKAESYPALQMSKYRFADTFDEVQFSLSAESYVKIKDHPLTKSLDFKEGKIVYEGSKKQSICYNFGTTLNVVLMGYPETFIFNKNLEKGKQYRQRKQGEGFSGDDRSAAKLFLAIRTPEGLLLTAGKSDEETGEVELPKIQIFTLLLKSNRTRIIGYDKDKSELKTFWKMNEMLCKKHKVREWLTPFYSVNITTCLSEYTSKEKNKSSVSWDIKLGSDCKPLSQGMTDLVRAIRTESLIKQIKDPFRLLSNDKPQFGDEEDYGF